MAGPSGCLEIEQGTTEAPHLAHADAPYWRFCPIITKVDAPPNGLGLGGPTRSDPSLMPDGRAMGETRKAPVLARLARHQSSESGDASGR